MISLTRAPRCRPTAALAASAVSAPTRQCALVRVVRVRVPSVPYDFNPRKGEKGEAGSSLLPPPLFASRASTASASTPPPPRRKKPPREAILGEILTCTHPA